MALSPYDQSVYDAGYKYIPQSQYLLNPFSIPQGGGDAPTGIATTYQAQNMMGGGGGGGMPMPGLGMGSAMVHQATPGFQDYFIGTDGVQDTFVFTLGEGNGAGQPFDALTISANAFGADSLENFNPADGDKIKIFDTDGVTPINNPLGSNVVALTTEMPGMGSMTLLHVNGFNEVLYSTTDTDLAQGTISNTDFTVA